MDWLILLAITSIFVGLGLAYMLFEEVFGPVRGEHSAKENSSPAVTSEERRSLTRTSTFRRFISKASSAGVTSNPPRSPSVTENEPNHRRN